MKRKRLRNLILWSVFFILVSAGVSFAEGNLRVHKTDTTYQIQDQSGNLITDDNQIEFFIGAPPAPTDPSGAILPPGPKTEFTDYYNYYFGQRSGDTPVWIRSWSGPPRTQGSRYGKSKLGYNVLAELQQEEIKFPAPPAPASQYYVATFQTRYLAEVPNAPSLGIVESMVRDGSTTNTEATLNITVTPQTGTAPNIREVGGNSRGNYAISIVNAAETTPAWQLRDNLTGGPVTITGPSLINQNGGSFVVKGEYLVAGETYTITAWNRNWFTAADDSDANTTAMDWTLLGAEFGGPQSMIITLESDVAAGGTGINTISMPFGSPWYAYAADGISPLDAGDALNQVENAYELVVVINTAATGSNVVTAFGYWDKDTQTEKGVIIPNGLITTAIEADLKAISIDNLNAFQVFVTEDEITFTISNQ